MAPFFPHKYARTCLPFSSRIDWKPKPMRNWRFGLVCFRYQPLTMLDWDVLEWSTCDNWLKFNPVYQFEGFKESNFKIITFCKCLWNIYDFLKILAPNCASNCASNKLDTVNVNSARAFLVFESYVLTCNFVNNRLIKERTPQTKYIFTVYILFSHYTERGFA